MPEMDRILGEHGARLTAAENNIESVEADIKRMREDIAAIREMMAEAKGGWRVMMLIGGASATAGGLIVKYLPIFRV